MTQKITKKTVESIEYDLTGDDPTAYPVSLFLNIERKKKSYLQDLSVPEVLRLGAVICQALTELANDDEAVLKTYPEIKPFLKIYGELSDKLYPGAKEDNEFALKGGN